MKTSNHTNLWRVTGASVQGAAHIRSGKPNQDAIGFQPETGEGLPILITVSDGHGSVKSFRSDQGSKFAISVALEIFNDFLFKVPKDLDVNGIEDNLYRANIPKKIVQAWRQAVDEDLDNKKFEEQELQSVIESGNEAYVKSIHEDPYVAYGATLIAVVITELFICFLQIGDGDILCIDALGDTNRVFNRDSRLLANETTSLCLSNAVDEFQMKVIPANEFPEMVIVCTDGYSNSFSDDMGFLKIGNDYYEIIQKYGFEFLVEHLPNFLRTTSDEGSGDDITIGILKRNDYFGVDFGRYHEKKIQTLEENFRYIEDDIIARFTKLQNLVKDNFQASQQRDSDAFTRIMEMQDHSDNLDLETKSLGTDLSNTRRELSRLEDDVNTIRDSFNKFENRIQLDLDNAIQNLNDEFTKKVSSEQKNRESSVESIHDELDGHLEQINSLQGTYLEVHKGLSNLKLNIEDIGNNLQELKDQISGDLLEISTWRTAKDRQLKWIIRATVLLAAIFIVILLILLFS